MYVHIYVCICIYIMFYLISRRVYKTNSTVFYWWWWWQNTLYCKYRHISSFKILRLFSANMHAQHSYSLDKTVLPIQSNGSEMISIFFVYCVLCIQWACKTILTWFLSYLCCSVLLFFDSFGLKLLCFDLKMWSLFFFFSKIISSSFCCVVVYFAQMICSRIAILHIYIWIAIAHNVYRCGYNKNKRTNHTIVCTVI